MSYAYKGHILRVNLSRGEIISEDINSGCLCSKACNRLNLDPTDLVAIQAISIITNNLQRIVLLIRYRRIAKLV